MIVKREGGFHVLSEKGKNLGGPYKTKAQAVHRLQQVEYFKKQGSIDLEFLEQGGKKFLGMSAAGTFAVKQLMDMSYDKALSERINRGKGLTKKEKQLAAKVDEPIPLNGPQTFHRINTSPYHVPATVLGMGTAQVLGSKYWAPGVLQKAYDYQEANRPGLEKLPKDNEVFKDSLHWISLKNAKARAAAGFKSLGGYKHTGLPYEFIKPEEIAKLKNIKALKQIAPYALAAASLIGLGYKLRNRKAQQLIDASKQENDPSLFIRTKLREDSLLNKKADIGPEIATDIASIARRIVSNIDLESPEKTKEKIEKKIEAIIEGWKDPLTLEKKSDLSALVPVMSAALQHSGAIAPIVSESVRQSTAIMRPYAKAVTGLAKGVVTRNVSKAYKKIPEVDRSNVEYIARPVGRHLHDINAIRKQRLGRFDKPLSRVGAISSAAPLLSLATGGAFPMEVAAIPVVKGIMLGEGAIAAAEHYGRKAAPHVRKAVTEQGQAWKEMAQYNIDKLRGR